MITQAELHEYIANPEFGTVLDVLVEAGLLAGQWTAADLERALALLARRAQIHEDIQSVQLSAQSFEEIAYSLAAVAAVSSEKRMSRWNSAEGAGYKRIWKRNWRAIEENRAAEMERESELARKRRNKQRRVEKSARLESLKEARLARKAQLRAIRTYKSPPRDSM